MYLSLSRLSLHLSSFLSFWGWIGVMMMTTSGPDQFVDDHHHGDDDHKDDDDDYDNHRTSQAWRFPLC